MKTVQDACPEITCETAVRATQFNWLTRSPPAKSNRKSSTSSTPNDSPPRRAPLLAKPLYEFTESETGLYLGQLQAAEPDLRRRIIHLARKNLGQPYELYLLGEMPFETYDPQPIYSLTKSDCLVFTEHTLAMALSRDWPGCAGSNRRPI